MKISRRNFIKACSISAATTVLGMNSLMVYADNKDSISYDPKKRGVSRILENTDAIAFLKREHQCTAEIENANHVVVSQTSMCVETQYNALGIITNCRLLTNEETQILAEKNGLNLSDLVCFEETQASFCKESFALVNETTQASTAVQRGTVSGTHHTNLTMTLTVADSGYTYSITGRAKWADGIYVGGLNDSEIPSTGLDHIGITWGGNGELKATGYTCSGEYQDGSAVAMNKNLSDDYKGYCWDFYETKSDVFAPCLDYAACTARLVKTDTVVKNKETSIQLNYIHTYNLGSCSVSFTSPTPGISYTSSGNSWNGAESISGITY